MSMALVRHNKRLKKNTEKDMFTKDFIKFTPSVLLGIVSGVII